MICASNRARLCKKRELEENCSADTICEFDCELIWSSTTRTPMTAPSMEHLIHLTSLFSMHPTPAHSVFPLEAHLNISTEEHSIYPS